MNTKYHTFEEYKNVEYARSLEGQIATQLMRMYRCAREIDKPSILELGTAKGASTTVFLQACEERAGRLVSIDIQDCSGLSASSRWQFVQSDSIAIEAIIAEAPHLNDGIDVLYIDSAHNQLHVERELTGWYPFLNSGAHIFFDDVDANPYRSGQRKDDFHTEIELDEIHEYVKAFFYANDRDLYLDIMYGSTGLAHLYKLCPKGTTPNPPDPPVRRRRSAASMFRHVPRLALAALKRRIVKGPQQGGC